MEKWEIWDAYVPYDEDENDGKERPVLIYNVISDDNVVSIKMTSHIARNERECEVKRWSEAGLSKPTVIRTDKIYRLNRRNFIRKRGKLQMVDIFRYENHRVKL